MQACWMVALGDQQPQIPSNGKRMRSDRGWLGQSMQQPQHDASWSWVNLPRADHMHKLCTQ